MIVVTQAIFLHIERSNLPPFSSPPKKDRVKQVFSCAELFVFLSIWFPPGSPSPQSACSADLQSEPKLGHRLAALRTND